METNSQQHKDLLYSMIEDAYGKVVYTYTTQIIHAGRLKKRYTVLKWLQMILSALSTGGFLGSVITNKTALVWAGGLCSVVLLALTAYFKDSEFSNTYAKHHITSNSLWIIREEYLALLTDFQIMSTDEIIKKRDDLRKKTSKIYESAPLTDAKSYSLAQKAIKDNESQFFSREELNHMEPEKLRK
ncbi:MAG: SLATT domain-containing protein [Clostridia bacterium]|nr:SLATT domain-containing protein [Clostridia bacterium]